MWIWCYASHNAVAYRQLICGGTQFFPFRLYISRVYSIFSWFIVICMYILSLVPDVPLGHKWRSHRKLIAPTFHLNVLKGFIDLFNENSRQVIRKLDLELGKTFDAHDYMSEATVEILLGKSNLCAFPTFISHTLSHIYHIHYYNLENFRFHSFPSVFI